MIWNQKHLALVLFILALSAAGTAAQEPQAGDKFPMPAQPPLSTSAPALPRTVGSLAIQAIQGSKDGAPIGAVPVEIQLLHRGTVIDTRTTQLDEYGVVVLENIPISMGVQPIVRVQHAGLTYQVAGGLMDPTHPEQKLEVVCYEFTERTPEWTISMRHVMIGESPEGLKVTEVIVIENPDDRTWIGGQPIKNKRVTTEFALPENAANVTLGRGFHDWCCSTLADSKLCNHLPLMPGQTEMVYGYMVPARNGKARIEIAAPARIDHLMVLAPESMVIESAPGLESGGVQKMGEASVQYYLASGMQKGERATITLAGLSGAATGQTGIEIVKTVAAAGAGIILLAGFVIILHRKPARKSGLSVSTESA